MIILYGCWVYMFDTQKVPEVRNIGLASIEAVWPQLDMNGMYDWHGWLAYMTGMDD